MPSIFGTDVRLNEALVHLIPVPFDATCSYRTGSAFGPRAILDASDQVDDTDPNWGPLDLTPTAALPIDENISVLSAHTRPSVEQLIRIGPDHPDAPTLVADIDRSCTRMQAFVLEHARHALDHGHIPGIVGGEHSVSLGAIRACSMTSGSIGLLQIDAHMDLRHDYQAMRGSHASVMRRALEELSQLERIVQVGIRDVGAEEAEYAALNPDRIITFPDPLDTLDSASCARIIHELPDRVYLSVDIDGLDPSLCPDTGTPVPGGLDWRELTTLLLALRESSKTIVGFDLVEVAPSSTSKAKPGQDWNAIVGARVLQRLCSLAGHAARRSRGP